MKFRHRPLDELEINLIPFIDILLVIIIFLMLTTTYNRIAALQIRLPDANAEQQNMTVQKVDVVVTADGTFAINGTVVSDPSVSHLAQLLRAAAGEHELSMVVINADGNSSHQSVVNVMDAARQAGLSRLTFATRSEQP